MKDNHVNVNHLCCLTTRIHYMPYCHFILNRFWTSVVYGWTANHIWPLHTSEGDNLHLCEWQEKDTPGTLQWLWWNVPAIIVVYAHGGVFCQKARMSSEVNFVANRTLCYQMNCARKLNERPWLVIFERVLLDYNSNDISLLVHICLFTN